MDINIKHEIHPPQYFHKMNMCGLQVGGQETYQFQFAKEEYLHPTHGSRGFAVAHCAAYVCFGRHIFIKSHMQIVFLNNNI